MQSHIGSAKLAMAAIAIAVVSTLAAAPASAAERYRSFYQNAGANCHGVNSTEDNRLSRTEQSLRNNFNTYELDVVCNLMTDGYANFTPNFGTVTGVYLWARRLAIRADNETMTCTMTTSFAGDPATQSFPLTINLPATTTDQAIFEWVAPEGERFLGPVNIRCLMPRKTGLNDWLVEYVEDIGD